MSVAVGQVQDLVGLSNTAGSELVVKVRPRSSGLEGLAAAANAGLGVSLATCLGGGALGSWLRPLAPRAGALSGCGALGLLGYAQTFYLAGQLGAGWLPQSYRQVAGSFGWTVGEIR